MPRNVALKAEIPAIEVANSETMALLDKHRKTYLILEPAYKLEALK